MSAGNADSRKSGQDNVGASQSISLCNQQQSYVCALRLELNRESCFLITSASLKNYYRAENDGLLLVFL